MGRLFAYEATLSHTSHLEAARPAARLMQRVVPLLEIRLSTRPVHLKVKDKEPI